MAVYHQVFNPVKLRLLPLVECTMSTTGQGVVALLCRLGVVLAKCVALVMARWLKEGS